MKQWIMALLLMLAIFNIQEATAQVSASQMAAIDIDSMSDEQILTYWNKAKAEGYTLEQLEVLAKSKGMSAVQFSKLKSRINKLKYSESISESSSSEKSNATEISDLEKFGLEGGIIDEEIEKNPLFGYDFFSNPNISFTPNLNLATPATYQLGPGDELLIDIWGAAENNYRRQVDREGAIRLENIGPIYVSGLSIDKAKEKIIAYLKRIYSGIGASSSSYNKVYADVSLVGVRTVQVNIIGEVKVPGTYSLSALSTVLNALYAAGGPTENGTFRNIKVVRGGEIFGIFDIYNYLIEGSEEGNVMLRDQDIIIVQPYIGIVKVSGEVKRPGLYEIKNGETINNLIHYFSGFTSDAYKNRLVVERVNGEQKEVNEIDLNLQKDFMLRDGDSIAVGAVIDRYKNRVSIEGAVYRPGDYELSKGLLLSDLIQKAAGVMDNAFLDRGIIYRTIDDVKQEIVSFSVQQVLDKSFDIELKREDKVQIFDKYSLKEKYTVSINGAVNNPKTFQFYERMRVEDLIAMAGGFKEGANVEVIDISRRVADGTFENISKNIKYISSNNLKVNSKEVYLEPFDRVSVRYIKGFTAQKNVSITGEVNYPGDYSITNKDERISDLIDKAGGLSPYAYIKGATLVRKLSESSEKEQIKLLETMIEQDTTLVDIETDVKEFKIGIDLGEILSSKGKKSKYDLILNEGDVLIVPSEKQTVEVRGEILAPSLVRYDKSNSFKDYINSSGGFSQEAKKSKGYVIYSNGDVRSTKNFLFFKSYPKIEPGALIVIPQKAERTRMSIQEVLGITTGITTLGILIDNLVK
ncbi:SLBB domain-containing protein [Lutibacter sp. B1]|uniref:SLBB domain-containing protein n=1 Tax=Lutibacter sp. B1 TaxID=2725996 RepID=UPI001FFCDB9F|nr:SLBB domain-containing protein [Lutibacter sp. B1]